MGRPEKVKPLPSKETLDMLLKYEPETGSLTWRERDISTFGWSGVRSPEWGFKHYHARFANRPAGAKRRDGYATVMIGEQHYKVHRVIWKIMTGDDPIEIDHINGDQGDNRFNNLRSVERPINCRNKSLYENNKSGFPGVEFHNRDLVWLAKIGAGNKQIHLGSFPTKDEAIACRIGAEVVLAYHANHGRQKYEE